MLTFVCWFLIQDFPSWHHLWQQCQVFRIPSTNKVCIPFIPQVIALGLPGKKRGSTATQSEQNQVFNHHSVTSLWTGNSLEEILKVSQRGKIAGPPGGFHRCVQADSAGWIWENKSLHKLVLLYNPLMTVCLPVLEERASIKPRGIPTVLREVWVRS